MFINTKLIVHWLIFWLEANGRCLSSAFSFHSLRYLCWSSTCMNVLRIATIIEWYSLIYIPTNQNYGAVGDFYYFLVHIEKLSVVNNVISIFHSIEIVTIFLISGISIEYCITSKEIFQKDWLLLCTGEKLQKNKFNLNKTCSAFQQSLWAC